jgi:hypothetical protein
MCDYSLEMYASRPAREGEQYQTTRFASGSIGVTVPKDGTTAICIACDTRLEIEVDTTGCHGELRRETPGNRDLLFPPLRRVSRRCDVRKWTTGFPAAAGRRRAGQRRAAGHCGNPAGTDCRTRLNAICVKQAARARACLLSMHFCLLFIHIAQGVGFGPGFYCARQRNSQSYRAEI